MKTHASEAAEERATLQLSQYLPYRLSVLSNTVSEAIARDYRSQFGLSVPQWRVIAVLSGEPGLSAKDVSARTAMDQVAVSRAVSKLLEAGYVQREGSQSDGRVSALFLTEAGQEVYGTVAPRALAFEEQLMAGLSPSERAELQHLLGKLASAVSPDKPLW
ncbi:MAG: MarR family winged helix-turn-helix transcriptional regulator [Pseudomonadota bacterium]